MVIRDQSHPWAAKTMSCEYLLNLPSRYRLVNVWLVFGFVATWKHSRHRKRLHHFGWICDDLTIKSTKMMVFWGSYPQNQLISAWQLTKIRADSPNSPKALWHDAELKLLAWGMLNALFMATWLVLRHALPQRVTCFYITSGGRIPRWICLEKQGALRVLLENSIWELWTLWTSSVNNECIWV